MSQDFDQQGFQEFESWFPQDAQDPDQYSEGDSEFIDDTYAGTFIAPQLVPLQPRPQPRREQEIRAAPAPVPLRPPTRRIRPPPVPSNHTTAPPPFQAPYPEANFEAFTCMQDAKDYAARVNNKNDAYVAIPIAFINRIRDDVRRMPTYGYIIHH